MYIYSVIALLRLLFRFDDVVATVPSEVVADIGQRRKILILHRPESRREDELFQLCCQNCLMQCYYAENYIESQ